MVTRNINVKQSQRWTLGWDKEGMDLRATEAAWMRRRRRRRRSRVGERGKWDQGRTCRWGKVAPN